MQLAMHFEFWHRSIILAHLINLRNYVALPPSLPLYLPPPSPSPSTSPSPSSLSLSAHCRIQVALGRVSIIFPVRVTIDPKQCSLLRKCSALRLSSIYDATMHPSLIRVWSPRVRTMCATRRYPSDHERSTSLTGFDQIRPALSSR